MNKYKWLIGLIFINLIGISLQANTIHFRTLRGSSFFELENSAVPSLTYDGLLDLLLGKLDKRGESTDYSKINKNLVIVLFQGKHLAHPHNFMKWKEMPFSDGLTFLLSPNPAENLRRVWFFDKVFHTGSWANHCHKLDIPADASVGSLKEMLKAELKLGASISLNDIKLFSSYENDTELNEADLQNESILAQGITFSFDSEERKIAISLLDVPAAVQAYYPQGLPFILKQHYTTKENVSDYVAELLNISSNRSNSRKVEVDLNSIAEPVSVSFTADLCNLKSSVRVLEVVDGSIKSFTRKHHDLLTTDISLYQYIKNKLANEQKGIDTKIAINSHKNGKTILQPNDSRLYATKERILDLEFIVVPADWQKVSVSFVWFNTAEEKQKLEHRNDYWLPVSHPEHWRFALAFQVHPDLLHKSYRSARYAPWTNEKKAFYGRSVFSEFLEPSIEIGTIDSLKIHLNPKEEEDHKNLHREFTDGINSIFTNYKQDQPLSLVDDIKKALLNIDRNTFASIHRYANERLFLNLLEPIERLDKRFQDWKGTKNLEKLFEIHNSCSALVEQIILVSDNQNKKRFNSIKQSQTDYIQERCNAMDSPQNPIEEQQQGMNFEEYQSFISNSKIVGQLDQLKEELFKDISKSNLGEYEKNFLLNELLDA